MNASATPTFARTITLRGRINCELIPHKMWRTFAKKGVKSASYRLSGDAEVDGQTIHVNLFVPAVLNGELQGLGSAVPENSQDKTARPFIVSLSPKKVNEIDSALFNTDAEGKAVLDADGNLVYAEPELLQDDGTPFDLRYGTHYFCPHQGGLTVRATDVTIAATDRVDPNDGRPYFDCNASGVEVVPTVTARASGGALFGAVKLVAAKQAARASKPAVAADVVM